MPAAEVVDLDDYERKKRILLPYEKLPASGFCFFFVNTVAIWGFFLYSALQDLHVIFINQSAGAARIPRGALIDFAHVLIIPLALCALLYAFKAARQSRPRASMAMLVPVVLPLLAGFIYAVCALPQFRQLLILVWNVYTAHWASIVEILVITALLMAAGAGLSSGRQVRKIVWHLSERDKLFLREDPERSLYRGRVLLTALGIPRIVDLMPRRRLIAMAEFVLAYYLFALSIGAIFIYLLGFFMLRVITVLNDYGGLATAPYVRDTAVSHMLYSLAMTFALLFLAPIVGGYFLTGAQRNVRWSIAELLQADSRPPILFLRAFKDDQVQLPNVKLGTLGRLGRWLDAVSNLDRLLLEEGTPYGPVVAIGNPSDRLPPYGAARGYFDDKTWQSAVADLATKAEAIVICLDRTEGIWWEVDHIARLGYLAKTLFLIHPKDSAEAENRTLANEVTKKLTPEPAPATLDRIDGSATAGAAMNGTLLGFFFDGASVMHAGRSTTFSRIAYLVQVRWFLRSKFGFAIPAGNERQSSRTKRGGGG